MWGNIRDVGAVEKVPQWHVEIAARFFESLAMT
jgi:hypothetical protein